MGWSLFMQHLVNAISLGFVFGLVAVGYALVYGVVKLVNFAHGDVFMMGAYMMFYTSVLFGFPWLAAVIFGIALTALLGVGEEGCLQTSQKVSKNKLLGLIDRYVVLCSKTLQLWFLAVYKGLSQYQK